MAKADLFGVVLPAGPASVARHLESFGITTCEEFLGAVYAYGEEAVRVAPQAEAVTFKILLSKARQLVLKTVRGNYLQAAIPVFPLDPVAEGSTCAVGGSVTVRTPSAATQNFEEPGVEGVGRAEFAASIPLGSSRSNGSAVISPPVNISLIGRCMPPIRYQGQRHTCVAFSLCTCMEFAWCRWGKGRDIGFSEQFAYWLAKTYDGMPTTNGTLPGVLFPLAGSEGVVRRELWPYNPLHDPANITHDPPPAECLDSANRHKRRHKFFSVKSFSMAN